MLNAIFKNLVYSKKTGHYEGQIIEVSVTGRGRLQLEIRLSDSTEVFAASYPWPLTPQHEVTKMLEAAAISAEELASGDFDLNELKGTFIEFDIENVEKNGRTFSNAKNLAVIDEEE